MDEIKDFWQNHIFAAITSYMHLFIEIRIKYAYAAALVRRDVSFWTDEIIILITFLSKIYRNERCACPNLPIKAACLPHFIAYL